MDPITTIKDYITTNDDETRRDLGADYDEWIVAGGYPPLFSFTDYRGTITGRVKALGVVAPMILVETPAHDPHAVPTAHGHVRVVFVNQLVGWEVVR